ncbi:hypothetical protein [Nocardioides sp. zg-1228]|uniref:hypothetical protein n=1 Tax=Nocardioides sp. zg-1228 TaxID=2763008 RepID=UPI0016432936|nr:hypothetical protein [Nocardioides sp. zg-1228]MBC2934230.1 hypothetical protein [Nocardioides sp. zg-1228]QSF59012.1 hypothetical protein JX575_07545 [Nocardioides sp. zg-1228]
MVNMLAVPAGLYRGTVTGPESGDCQCRIDVRRLTEHAMSVDYEAVGVSGLQHVEHTIVTASALHVVASEFPTVVTFRRTGPGRYVADVEGPAMEIHPGWDGASLTWAWHWAPPGEEAREQSRAVARQVR